jgi:hypothetical protein
MTTSLLCRLTVSGVLLLAAGGKALSMKTFAETVTKLGRLTGRPAVLLAVAVTFVELTVGFWMAVSVSDQNAYAAIGLFSLFSIVVSLNLVSRNAAECGCFPLLKSVKATWRLVIRNGALSTMAWLAMSPKSVSSFAPEIFTLSVLVVICTLAADSQRVGGAPRPSASLNVGKRAATI